MRKRVAAAQVARLATVSSDGAPHLVPFCFVLDGDVLYSAVDHKPKRAVELQRLRNMAAEPRVCVLVDHYEADWSQLWWVRLDGRASRVEPGAEAERALDGLAAKYPPYEVVRPKGALTRIEVERWTGWSAAEAASQT